MALAAVETNQRVELGFAAFDADNHYYEAEDAFTRHMPREMAKRCMQWAEIDGKKRLLVGGRVNRFIPNPTFNPVSKPGALDAYFRGKVSGGDMRTLFGELDPISPAYRNRDARVALMKEQGLSGAMFFPTLAVGMEESLRGDVTLIVIAHRLSTVMHADKIFVLEQGKIIEQGRHDVLLEEKGLYYAMWRQQIGERK